MQNIFDYLNWRGDLSFAQDKFNNIDALILSRLSYLPFEHVVPQGFNKNVKLGFAALAFSPLENKDAILWKRDPDLLNAAGRSTRFENITACGYVSSVDYKSKMQFAAITFDLGNGERFVSFRGTDATFVGWEEDFNMFTSLTLPSQLAALKYFEQAAESGESFILGGHSKGGNLALYSAMNCVPSIQDKIEAVYNFDGPGFHSEILKTEQYEAVKDRIRSFVPQSSVFGMMLEHDEEFSIVESTNKSFMQHDIYSWQVMGRDFMYLDRRTNSSRFISHTLDGFLEKMSDSEKENFIKAFFTVLESTKSTDFREIPKSPISSSAALLKGIKNLDKSKRGALGKAIAKAASSAKDNFTDIIKREQGAKVKKEKKRKNKK